MGSYCWLQWRDAAEQERGQLYSSLSELSIRILTVSLNNDCMRAPVSVWLMQCWIMDRGHVIKSERRTSVSNSHEMKLISMTLRSSSIIAACAALVPRRLKPSMQLFKYVRVKLALGEAKEGSIDGWGSCQSHGGENAHESNSATWVAITVWFYLGPPLWSENLTNEIHTVLKINIISKGRRNMLSWNIGTIGHWG